MRKRNDFSLLKIGFWCLLIPLLSACEEQADSAVRLTVTTDCREAVRVQLEPLSHWLIYKYAEAEIDTGGQAVLQYKTDVPFLAEVKIKNKVGRVIQTVRVYVTPSSGLQIDIKGKGIDFKGKNVVENRDLQLLAPLFSRLYGKNADTGKIQKQAEDILRDKTYASDFKKEVLKAIDLHVRSKQLVKNIGDSAAVKALLQELQVAPEWLFLHTWPTTLDDVFTQAEALGLLPSSENGYEYRLQSIGNDELRSRYGIYLLQNLIRSRSWFGHTPTDIIHKAEPYLSIPAAKGELSAVVQEMEDIDAQWAHLLCKPAPDFTFEAVDGKKVSLSDFRGKFVLLDVWNIFCGPCMDQIPHLKRMEPTLTEMGVEVIGVSADPRSLQDQWSAVVREKGMAGTQIIMDNGRKSQFMTDYVIIGFPTFCLINPEGYVMHPRMVFPENPYFMGFIEKKIAEYKASK